MKNFIRLSVLLLGIVFISSCTDDGLYNTKKNFSSANAYFYGDPQGYNLYYYDLFLYDKNLTSNQNGTGVMVYLALNCPITAGNSIESHTYNVNSASSPQLYTFERGVWNVDSQTGSKTASGSYVGIVKNGKLIEYKLIINGSAIISQSGNYVISANVTTEDNKQYELKYDGAISFIDMIEPLPNTLSKGELWYLGNVYNNNLNIYTIRLGASDVDLSTFSGSGDALQIEVYTPTSETTGIPTGTYPIKTIGDNIVNTALAGEYNSTDNADYGTVYYTSDKLFINKGSISITNKGGNNYNLNFNFTDDYYGYIITRSFDINLPFINRASGVAPQKARIANVQNRKVQRNESVKINRFNRYEKSNRKTLKSINQR